MNLPLPSISWSDFARSPGESQHPELWHGVRGLWVPALGPTGAKLFDVSGRGFHGAFAEGMNSATDWVTTPRGWATHAEYGPPAWLDHYVTLPASALADQTADFTIDCLLRVTNATQIGSNASRVVYSSGSQSNFWYLGCGYHADSLPPYQIQFSIRSIGTRLGATTLNVGEWHHFCWQYKHLPSNTLKMFVDGVVDYDGTSPDALTTPTGVPLLFAPSGFTWAQPQADILYFAYREGIHGSVTELARTPLAMLLPHRRRVWPAAAAATTNRRRRFLLGACG